MIGAGLAGGTLLIGACTEGDGRVETETSGATMGTSWHVRVVAPRGWTPERVTAAVQPVLDGVDAAMSTWDPRSELSRFNQSRPRPDEWVSVSPATAVVVDRALHWWRESGGAFDVTVGPLLHLYGFGPEPSAGPPVPEALAAARARVGSQHLDRRLDPPALRKELPGLTVDLSAIAKGYAVDRVAAHLRDAGCDAAMVEVGGEVACFGKKLSGEPWSIGIERPVVGTRRLDRTLALEDRAMASSGDYRNFVTVAGERLSHTFDPRTGAPVRHSLASVTVVGPSCADADAQCTAIMALGPGPGYAWALEQGLAARLVERVGDRFSVRCTPAFARDFGDE